MLDGWIRVADIGGLPVSADAKIELLATVLQALGPAIRDGRPAHPGRGVMLSPRVTLEADGELYVYPPPHPIIRVLEER